ncbi:MAG: hypothetical protein QW594_01300 [Candidatus Woesearchaeota archaeon]
MLKKTITILIDTNALMAIFQERFDLFSALEQAFPYPTTLAVLSGTLTELQQLASLGKTKDAKAAKLSLQLLEAKHLKIIPHPQDMSVDDALVAYASPTTIILTQDRILQKRLKQKPAPYLVIRKKKYVELIGHVL